mmetsp:Transcript_25750/g.41194  ORF Transcript_25750/g.41194 Transcript_25750/m.41194 type:complete len:336 (-) Transcript_25750:1761-2768(-)
MMSLGGRKRPASNPAGAETETSRHVRLGTGEITGPGSSAFTVKLLTIPTEGSPGQMPLESPLLLPGLLAEPSPTTGIQFNPSRAPIRAPWNDPNGLAGGIPAAGASGSGKTKLGFGKGKGMPQKGFKTVLRDTSVPVRRSPLSGSLPPKHKGVKGEEKELSTLGYRREGERGGAEHKDRAKERERVKERDKIKLESFRSEKDKVVRDKSFKIPEDKETETAKKRKIEKSTPTEVGSKGSLDYRVVALTSDVRIDDGYRWRKYGQKLVKGSPFPRSYYKCTSGTFTMQKHVEQSADNPKLFLVTYHVEQTQANDMYAKLKELGPMLSDITIHSPGE